MSDIVRAQEFDNVPCPFCGLLCDDVRVTMTKGAATVIANGCAKSRVLFAANANDAAIALADGKPVDLATAIGRAPQILRAARQPLLISAGTDVAGRRVLIELAERIGRSGGHTNSGALIRNLRVFEKNG